MLKRTTTQPCYCCSDHNPGRTYSWMGRWHCLTCLHSLGRNAAGNFCTDRQYVEAWRVLVHGRQS